MHNIVLFFKDLFLSERESVRSSTCSRTNERKQGWKEGVRRGTGRQADSRLPTEPGAQHGVWLQDPEILTSAQVKSQRLNQLSHPGHPTMKIKFWNWCSSPVILHSGRILQSSRKLEKVLLCGSHPQRLWFDCFGMQYWAWGFLKVSHVTIRRWDWEPSLQPA